MTKFCLLVSCAAQCVLAAAVFSQSQDSKLVRASNALPGRYIVILNDRPATFPETYAAVVSRAAEVAGDHGGRVERIYSAALKGFSASMTDQQAIAMSRDPRVKLIEEDREISISDTQQNAPWNLDRVDQRNLPWDGMYNYAGMGSGVHVYVIDTGIRVTHTEFGGRASVSFDSVGDGQNGADCNGHGTHVAGIVGAATWGVAKQAYLHSVRVLPCSGTGPLSNVLAGVDWITQNHASPAVANISAAVAGASASLQAAITNSIASGVVYTIAAGNSAADACNYTPARTPAALTVGASDETDLRARYSNFGACIDLFAPGNLVVSTWASSDTATNNLSGSSMAAPMAGGVAALYLGVNPNAPAATVIEAVRVAATQNVLTINDPASPNRLLYSGVALSPTAATASISGRIVNAAGIGVRGVQLLLVDPTAGETLYVRSTQLGYFQFSDVRVGHSYVLTAASSIRFDISNNSRAITLTENLSGILFVTNSFTY